MMSWSHPHWQYIQDIISLLSIAEFIYFFSFRWGSSSAILLFMLYISIINITYSFEQSGKLFNKSKIFLWWTWRLLFFRFELKESLREGFWCSRTWIPPSSTYVHGPAYFSRCILLQKHEAKRTIFLEYWLYYGTSTTLINMRLRSCW